MIALICDDQKSVHTFFDNGVDWGALGIDRVHHARNGEQCLGLVGEHRPDILLLDIKMPGKTGIEVLKEIQGSGVEGGTIILSAHGEFRYAKEALTLGAFDYELKPIDAQRVTDRIRALVHIQRERYLTGLRNALLGIADKSPVPEEEVFARLGLEDFVCFLVRGEGREDSRVTACLAEHYRFVLYLGGGEHLVLCPVAGNDSVGAVRAVRGQFGELCSLLPGTRLRAALSARGRDLRLAYSQCTQALDRGFATGDDFCLFEDTARPADIERLLQCRSSLHGCLLNNSGEAAAMGCVDELFEALGEAKLPTADIIDTCFEILHYNISVILTESKASEIALFHSLRDCDTMQELKRAVAGTLRERFFPDTAPEPASTPLDNVRRHLETRYAEQITLEGLAKQFYISKYDLCRRFRQEYGEGIWDFLKRRRMEQAHALLVETDLKIYEIAERVGYNDPNYFSSIYRKYYGQSPYQAKQAAVTP